LKSQRGSYRQFLGIEMGLTVFSFFASFFLAGYFYPMLPALYDGIASLFPAPLAPTGFTIAYAGSALLIFLAVNTVLFFTGKRKI